MTGMWFYIKLAWRNILRNKRRTIIASIAIGIGLAFLLVYAGILKGTMGNMMRSSTSSFLGEAEIHGSDFRETQEVEKTINNLDRVTAELDKDPLVDKYTLRTLSIGMISSPANVNAVILVGVNPGTERFLSKYDDAVKNGEGDFFKDSNLRDIVIGSKLVEVLEAGLGDRVVVTVSRAKTGELSQEMFRISGIYNFGIKTMDTGMAFIRLPIAREMLGIPGQAHQVAIKFNDIRMSMRSDIPFWEHYSKYNNEAVSWRVLIPQFDNVLKMVKFGQVIMVFIMAGLVMFGIINVLFMSLYERMFEFGVLRAVGTRPGGIRKLILFEAGCLAVISIFMGIALGLIANFILLQTGLDYRGIEFAGTVLQDLLYPEMEWWYYIVYPIGVFIFTIIVGLYPAWAAGRLRIADAIRKSL